MTSFLSFLPAVGAVAVFFGAFFARTTAHHAATGETEDFFGELK